MEKDYFNMAGYNVPPYFGYEGFDFNNSQSQPDSSTMFNPIIQYEQAYMYYRYLSQQMDYKIKCKEYEKMSSNESQKAQFQRKMD